MYIVDFQDNEKNFKSAPFLTKTEAIIYAAELAEQNNYRMVKTFSDKTYRRYQPLKGVGFITIYHKDAYAEYGA